MGKSGKVRPESGGCPLSGTVSRRGVGTALQLLQGLRSADGAVYSERSDWVGGGINTYGYVGGNPLSFIDPLGLQQEAGLYTCLAGPNPVCGAFVFLTACKWALITSAGIIVATGIVMNAECGDNCQNDGSSGSGGNAGNGPGSNAGNNTDGDTGGNDTDGSGGERWPLDKGGSEWGRRNGFDSKEGRRAAHATKNSDYMHGAKDKYTIDPSTGDVYDPEGGYVGNAGDFLRTR